MEKKAVVFDLDGTLLDTLDDLTNAVNYVLRAHSYPEISRDKVRGYLGNGARELIKKALPESVEGALFEEYLAEYVEYYGKHSRIETKPYEGVPELLRELKANGISVAVVSNKPDAAVRSLCLEYFGELVDFSVGDKEDIRRKPAADPVFYALKSIGCDRAVFVGDSEVDIETAANAGLPCISLTWGFRDRDMLEKNGATVFADDAETLRNEIIRLLGEGG